MKNSVWVMILIVVTALSFLIGYSVAPREDLTKSVSTKTQKKEKAASEAGGYGQEDSGGYGAGEDTGGYGAGEDTGGYGVGEDTGGYGAQ